MSALEHAASISVASMVDISPIKRIKVDEWAEPSLGWREWKPTLPASHQLNEVSMPIQLRLFSRIITLS